MKISVQPSHDHDNFLFEVDNENHKHFLYLQNYQGKIQDLVNLLSEVTLGWVEDHIGTTSIDRGVCNYSYKLYNIV